MISLFSPLSFSPSSSKNMALSAGSICESSSSVFAQITSTSLPSAFAYSFTLTTFGISSSGLPISISEMFAA